MLAVVGNYDGEVVKPLDILSAKPNQRFMITVTDGFIDPDGLAKCEKQQVKIWSLAGKIDIDEKAVNELRKRSRICGYMNHNV